MIRFSIVTEDQFAQLPDGQRAMLYVELERISSGYYFKYLQAAVTHLYTRNPHDTAAAAAVSILRNQSRVKVTRQFCPTCQR